MAGKPEGAEAGITRRSVLVGLGAGAGLLAARGLGVPGLCAGPGSGSGGSGAEPALRALAASLSPAQRAQIVLPADHPSREIVNTLSVLKRPHLGTLLSPRQLAQVEALASAMLSPRGRHDLRPTFAVEGRFEGCVLVVYGEPERGGAEALLMGGHVMLRGGPASLAGGVAYGHQVGNHRWRVEGNSFAWHGDAANALYAALSADQRARAVQPTPPHELVLQPQGAGGVFPGVAFGSLAEEAREAAERLLDAALASFAEEAREEARASLAAQGGSDALHFATYASHGFYEDMRAWGELAPAERERRGTPYWQVWRVEGPGTVIHFQGWPHVHAYVRVVRDPARAHVGEVLGETREPLEGEAMRSLLEAALRGATGEALAWHPPEVPGRFCPGPVTSGLAYAMDPYGSEVAVATIRSEAMAEPLRQRLAAGGAPALPGRTWRIASTPYFASRSDAFGVPERVDGGGVLLRDALLEHLRRGGLARASTPASAS